MNKLDNTRYTLVYTLLEYFQIEEVSYARRVCTKDLWCEMACENVSKPVYSRHVCVLFHRCKQDTALMFRA